MLKGQKKHIDKEQCKNKHEVPRSVNYRATQNKNNTGTTALERSVVYTTGGLKAFHCTNLRTFILWKQKGLITLITGCMFKKIAQPSDFMHIFHDFIHVHRTWAGVDKPLRPKF